MNFRFPNSLLLSHTIRRYYIVIESARACNHPINHPCRRFIIFYSRTNHFLYPPVVTWQRNLSEDDTCAPSTNSLELLALRLDQLRAHVCTYVIVRRAIGLVSFWDTASAGSLTRMVARRRYDWLLSPDPSCMTCTTYGRQPPEGVSVVGQPVGRSLRFFLIRCRGLACIFVSYRCRAVSYRKCSRQRRKPGFRNWNAPVPPMR
jgi:hypothetical protein